MESKIKKGSYIKAIGGDFGIYFTGSKWVSFECLGCEIARGSIVPNLRLHNGNHPKLRGRIGYNFQSKHDKEIHNHWVLNGKKH